MDEHDSSFSIINNSAAPSQQMIADDAVDVQTEI